jgi:hypothetical protein
VSSPVILLLRDDPTHPATRVGGITHPTWDQVDMDMKDRLTGRLTTVDAHIPPDH